MNRVEFVLELDRLLYRLSKNERKEAISFYLELIDDMLEKGVNEEEAIASLGSIHVLAKQIISDDINNNNSRFSREDLKDLTSKAIDKGEGIFQKFREFPTYLQILLAILFIWLLFISPFPFIFPFILIVLVLVLDHFSKSKDVSPENRSLFKKIIVGILIALGVVMILPFVLSAMGFILTIFIGGGFVSIFSGISIIGNLLMGPFNNAILIAYNIGIAMVVIPLGIFLIIGFVEVVKALSSVVVRLFHQVKKYVNSEVKR